MGPVWSGEAMCGKARRDVEWHGKAGVFHVDGGMFHTMEVALDAVAARIAAMK